MHGLVEYLRSIKPTDKKPSKKKKEAKK